MKVYAKMKNYKKELKQFKECVLDPLYFHLIHGQVGIFKQFINFSKINTGQNLSKSLYMTKERSLL